MRIASVQCIVRLLYQFTMQDVTFPAHHVFYVYEFHAGYFNAFTVNPLDVKEFLIVQLLPIFATTPWENDCGWDPLPYPTLNIDQALQFIDDNNL